MSQRSKPAIQRLRAGNVSSADVERLMEERAAQAREGAGKASNKGKG
jgi:predicted nuclease of predicted toxin-antitoxin system